ncbi:MAG TPA: hypothetical protein PKL17_17000, partial [Pseudomonadota bacterium]|nr:hypothetical protein [Pseudomonadota bacterium]
IPSDTPQTQGIESIISTENSTATGQFSILCRINSAIERLTINSQLTPQFAKTENHKSWSLVSGNNGTLHAVIEYLPSISKDTFYQSLSVSTSPVFSNSNLAPVMPTNTESISKIIVGKFPSKYDGAIAWSANGTNVYYSILNDPINNIKYNTLSKTSQYPQISGCNDSALELCSVALADIIDGDAGELIVARHNGIMIYKDGTSNNTIFIPTETEPQAVSVSINNDKNMRKLIWASSKFENNKNTVTIHTIPVSSIM